MIRTTTLAAISLAAAFTVAHAQKGTCTVIQFAPGTSSATVQGNAPADTPFPCYLLKGVDGKTATVQITKPRQGVAFNIAGIVDNRDNFSFKTAGRPYLIDVYDMGRGGSTSFSMTVTVK